MMTHPIQTIVDLIDGKTVSATPQPPSLVGKGSQMLAEAADTEETLLWCIAQCSALDHSDTDNGVRLRAYFKDDILVMRENDVSGGSFLAWTGKYWDLNGGAAAAAMLAQRVGDLIAREVDYLTATPLESDIIQDAAEAKSRRDTIDALPESEDEAEMKARGAELRLLDERIEAGKRVRAALATRKKARRKFGVSSKNAGRLRAMLECAAPHLRRHPDDFNANPHVIASENHTLHFVQVRDDECPDPDVERQKWQLDARPGHRREDLITALVPVAFNAEATAPRWEAFLERFMPMAAQAEKRRTLQQYCGVSLLGVLVQYVMYHYGLGANGKSVFLETLMRLLGPSFAVSLPPETLIGKSERNAGQASPDIMRLFGKRMLRVAEVPADRPLQESLIKHITGGEEVTARTLFKGYVDFANKAKPHMSGNGFPKIDGTDNGIWRRMLVMHWTETIADRDQRNLDDVVRELLTEASGILNWLIDGAVDFLNNGLCIAPAVRQATQEYRDEMDTMGQFARDCIEAAMGEAVTARELYDAYCAWCVANAKRPVFETKFGRVMKTRYERTDTRVRKYLDICLHDVPWGAAKKASPDDPPYMADAA
jgi:putative DNA primase/helicase